MKNALVLLTVTLFSATALAQSVKEKKARAEVDQRFADTTAKVKDCGKTFKFVYDWKSYDAIDWKKVGKEKIDSYPYEVSNLDKLGDAINELCADKDYKEALSKVSTIVYKPTNNDKITVKAVVASGTLTFENFSFGSTRDASDYGKAAKDAL